MQQSIFDLLGSEFDEYKTKESNDWYWHFKDYPKSNGLKGGVEAGRVFSGV